MILNITLYPTKRNLIKLIWNIYMTSILDT